MSQTEAAGLNVGLPKGFAPDMPPAGAPKAMMGGGMLPGPPIGAKAGPSMLGRLPDMASAPAMSFRKMLFWALAVVGGAWVGFLAATGLETLRKLLTQYNAKLLGEVINALRGGASGHADLAATATLFAALSVALIVLQFASQIASVWVDSDMVRRLQQRLLDKLLALGPAYHDTLDAGRTQMVVMSFAAGAQPTLKQFISFPLVDGIALAGALYLLFQQLNALADIPLSIDAVLGAVLIILPVAGYFLSRRVGRAAAANIRARQGLNTEFLNSAQMPAEVQVMGAAPQRSRAFAQRLATAVRAQRRATIEMQLASQFQDAVPTLLETGFVLYAVFVVLATGSAQVGAIVTILLLVPQVVAPIRDIISYLTGLSAAWPMVAEVGELLDAQPDSPAGEVPFPTDAPAAVDFADVSFAYAPAQPPVLNHVTHLFREHVTTAIVGRSGTGKSSILRLIAGLRAPDTGRVTIGGVAIRDIDPTDLRAAVVTV
jgi:ABC-type multidrug transport system fused ATPase/permease subunit